MGNFKEDIALVRAFVFDVDGVFTDGSITMAGSGEFIRTYNAKDGFAVATALKRGYPVAIISGGRGQSIEVRFQALGVTDLYLGSLEKAVALHDFREKYGLVTEEIMYVGDDIPDVEPMRLVGMPVCPKDAAPEVIGISRYVSGFGGGKGCVRDLVEQVLRARGDWFGGEFGYPVDTASLI